MEKVSHHILQNKYEIVSRIKQGGFGIVYYGFDRIFEKPIAIKAVEPSLLNDAKYVDLFLAEARNAAKLSHNNIVHIFDLVKDENGQYYIIMEFIEGYDLGRILRQCKKKKVTFPLDLSVYIIKEICKALEYAHNKRDLLTNKPMKLVHQDISPSNVMISVTGQVKLIDFGLARLRVQQKKSKDIVYSGKLPYMAPEQINGGVVDRRTDIFSLGTIFYELIIGERLIEVEDPNEALQKFKKFKINKTVLDEHDIPQLIQTVLIKMLQKNAEERYFGANGVYMDLIEFLMSNSHTVELSDELGAYIQDLYKEDQISESEIHEPVKEEKKPVPADHSDQHLSENKKKMKRESKEQAMQTEDSISVKIEADDEKQTNNGELEKLLSEIESDFSQPPKMKLVSKYDTKTIEESDAKEQVQKEFSKPLQLTVPSIVDKFKEEEEGEDDLKTVIDVIRLSAKTLGRKIRSTVIGLVVIMLILLSLDIVTGTSPVGRAIYNQFFPPAIRIETVPSGAMIYIDNQRVPGKTPLAIEKIQPGIHQLTLTHAGYAPIIKSLQVPPKGKMNVMGETNDEDQHSYTFHFKAQIEINSDPVGGTIFLNKVEYPQKTPAVLEWEVGKPLSIEMENKGFDRISDLTLNLLEENAEIKDTTRWNFRKYDGTIRKYQIYGKFRKSIKLKIIPGDVAWFVDGASKASGRSSSSDFLALSGGKHEILFRKQGFNDKLISLNINENAPESLMIILDRLVRIQAKDVEAADSTFIAATVTKYISNGKTYALNKLTPCEISLPAVETDIYLQKQGYQEQVITVNPQDTVVVAKMSVAPMEIEILVHDALTGLPVTNASITYQEIGDSLNSDNLFGLTDINGKCINSIKAGNYRFKAVKPGYYEKQLTLNTMNGANKLEFKLIIH